MDPNSVVGGDFKPELLDAVKDLDREVTAGGLSSEKTFNVLSCSVFSIDNSDLIRVGNIKHHPVTIICALIVPCGAMISAGLFYD